MVGTQGLGDPGGPGVLPRGTRKSVLPRVERKGLQEPKTYGSWYHPESTDFTVVRYGGLRHPSCWHGTGRKRVSRR